MKNKKEMSIRLRKRSIANLSLVKGGHDTTPGESHGCTGPKQCPTTIDPRADDFQSNDC
ncbi:hypothetical protein KORDIASMS9_00681 [Kordia sp. SMS9]|nr:hypothetical protein KORDIASMS9_00681 [Kordia sp. SMS9]